MGLCCEASRPPRLGGWLPLKCTSQTAPAWRLRQVAEGAVTGTMPQQDALVATSCGPSSQETGAQACKWWAGSGQEAQCASINTKHRNRHKQMDRHS